MYITKTSTYSFPYYVGHMCSLCKRYRGEISVNDNGGKENFVLLGDTGPELTGRQTTELIDNYFEVTHTHLIFHLPNNLN